MAVLTLRDRWLVASRVLAALAGYGLVSLFGIVLALLWPLPQAQAVMASAMLSFAVYAGLVLWVFSARSLRRVWWVLVWGCAVLGLLAWWLLPGGGV